ncbi:hypothetical protein HII36_30950 [Nonomuraea sp. NN258]|uniref:hypothetical protein n=1 Tax=Nonomuraea antri TaxID=2730852 RepID=UPI00156901C8|nr:hypothetical protein [Nonomuraea antri]NRQ36222.1 hypothetical protein [Nonomuraea antri]
MNHASIGATHGGVLVCSSPRHAAALHRVERIGPEVVAGIPLVPAGAGPGHQVPGHVAAAGMPRGACRRTRTAPEPSPRSDEWCERQWAAVKAVCPRCFNDDELARGVRTIEAGSGHPTDRLVLAHFDELITRYADHLAFGGRLSERHPRWASTEPLPGPAGLAYQVSYEVAKTVTASDGWAVGGTVAVEVAAEVAGRHGFTGGYTHCVANTSAWPESDTVHAHLRAGPGECGRVDVHGAGGRYAGLLYVTMTGFPRHDATGARCFDLGRHHVWTTCGYLCVPIADAFVKSPDSPSAVLRVHRTWPEHHPPPDLTFPEIA